MPNWIIIAVLLTLASILALGLFLLARQRKRDRIELRLATGRRGLLNRELESYLTELDELDADIITTKCQEAASALDQLHIALVERQAHLLNYEDMVHLQKCKIDVITGALNLPEELPEDPPEDLPPAVSSRPRPTSNPSSTSQDKKSTAQDPYDEARDRSTIESDLLDKINQLQNRRKPKK